MVDADNTQFAIARYVDYRLGMIGNPDKPLDPADAEWATMKDGFSPAAAKAARDRCDES